MKRRTTKKLNKKNKIQKNMDIEESEKTETETEEKTEREEFLSNIRVENEKKYQNIMDRKNALANDEERKCAYLKAMDKILKNEDEDTLEI